MNGSVFPSATADGENVKRGGAGGWALLPDAERRELAHALPGAPAGSLIVDLQNEARALTGAIVPRGGEWWFLKLLGDAPAVASARDAFTAFATKLP